MYVPEAFIAKYGPYSESFKVFTAPGCEACGNTGYKGRVGLHEVLISTDKLKKAIARKAPVEDIRRESLAGG